MRAAGDTTYSVSDLCGEIREFLGTAFDRLWVVGEIQRVRLSARGHLYFELIEKGSRDEVVAKLDCVAWRSSVTGIRKRLSQGGAELAEGMEIRCLGGVDFYGPGGRLQLIIRDVDPVFTLGLLARRRLETLEALRGAGLFDLNRQRALPLVPTRIGLITSEGSAAYHDFLSGLRESGFGFQVVFVHASVQGRLAERELVSALSTAATTGVDCLALVRGGGSRSDLAVFDSRAVAEAVARCPVPILTGLGHEIDQSIVDLISFSAFKTPTKVAEFLVERWAVAERRLEAVAAGLSNEAQQGLRRRSSELVRIERGLAASRHRVAATKVRMADLARAFAVVSRLRLRSEEDRRQRLAQRLQEMGPRDLERALRRLRSVGEPLARAGRRRLDLATRQLEALARLTEQLRPERVLERGYSITLDAEGKPLTRASTVSPGNRISTRLAVGRLLSQVEKVEKAEKAEKVKTSESTQNVV